MPDQTIPLTALALAVITDTTKYGKLTPGKVGPSSKDTQFAQIGVMFTDGSAADTGTLRFVLSDGTTVFAVREATLTVNAQSGLADGSGNTKMATAQFANGTDIMDLGGANDAKPGVAGKTPQWYVGLVTKPAGTTTLDASHPCNVYCTWLTGSAA